jgi:hypothetical protein
MSAPKRLDLVFLPRWQLVFHSDAARVAPRSNRRSPKHRPSEFICGCAVPPAPSRVPNNFVSVRTHSCASRRSVIIPAPGLRHKTGCPYPGARPQNPARSRQTTPGFLYGLDETPRSLSVCLSAVPKAPQASPSLKSHVRDRTSMKDQRDALSQFEFDGWQRVASKYATM